MTGHEVKLGDLFEICESVSFYLLYMSHKKCENGCLWFLKKGHFDCIVVIHIYWKEDIVNTFNFFKHQKENQISFAPTSEEGSTEINK